MDKLDDIVNKNNNTYHRLRINEIKQLFKI